MIDTSSLVSDLSNAMLGRNLAVCYDVIPLGEEKRYREEKAQNEHGTVFHKENRYDTYQDEEYRYDFIADQFPFPHDSSLLDRGF
jgi:hypothetical protein